MFLNLQGPTDIRSTLEYLMTLFPRKLFNDALPQIVFKHQLYSIHNDKTLVDKELVRRRASYGVRKLIVSSFQRGTKTTHNSFHLVHRTSCGREDSF